jgi:hypothetical protein
MMRPRRGTRENALDCVRVERPRPEPLELSRRPGKDDDDGVVEIEHQARRRSCQPERHRSLRPRRLFSNAGGEVGVRPSESVGEPPRDGSDLLLETLVEDERATRDAGDELDGAVVVRRAEPAGHETEIRREGIPKRALEIGDRVSDDLDGGGLETEPDRLGGKEGAVPVVPLATDELGAGRDDRRARAAQEVARTTLCEVTTNIVPFGSSTRLPLSRTTTFCGFASVSWRLLPSNDLR